MYTWIVGTIHSNNVILRNIGTKWNWNWIAKERGRECELGENVHTPRYIDEKWSSVMLVDECETQMKLWNMVCVLHQHKYCRWNGVYVMYAISIWMVICTLESAGSMVC